MSNQYIFPIGYAWVYSFLDTNKRIEHIVLVMHDIYPDPALILLSSNMLYYLRHFHINSFWKKFLTKQLQC